MTLLDRPEDFIQYYTVGYGEDLTLQPVPVKSRRKRSVNCYGSTESFYQIDSLAAAAKAADMTLLLVDKTMFPKMDDFGDYAPMIGHWRITNHCIKSISLDGCLNAILYINRLASSASRDGSLLLY